MTDRRSERPRTPPPILVLPDRRLRIVARPVRIPDPAIDRLVDDLVAAMHRARGLGLAAPQVGEPLAVAVIEIEGRLTVLVNPTLQRTRDEQVDWEACLSVPHLVAEVPRPNDVTVRAQELDGRWRTHRGRGLFARALMHETDHLAGRLYVDLVPAGALVDTREHPTPPRRSPGG